MMVGVADAEEVAIGQRLHHLVTLSCRAVDRRDADLLRDCFHRDAVEERDGSSLTIDELVARTIAAASAEFDQHAVTNFHVLGIRGDLATTETYWAHRCVGSDGELAHAFGRYLDRFERVGGQWRIAHRRCTTEWASSNAPDRVDAPTGDAPDPSEALAAAVAPLAPHGSQPHVDGVVA